MGIGKSKNDNPDIISVINRIDTETKVSDAEKKMDDRLRKINAANEKIMHTLAVLETVAPILDNAIISLNNAIDCSNDIVNGITDSIDTARKTVFVAKMSDESVNFIKKIHKLTLSEESKLLASHIEEQCKQFVKQKEDLQKIVSQNQGVWISSMWLKIFGGVMIFYTLVVAIYAILK